MATQYRRIALTRDPAIDRALRFAASRLGPKPAATIARELILRGARDLESTGATELDAWLSTLGATPAGGPPSELLTAARALGPSDPRRPHPVSTVLAELREDRI